MAVEMELLEIIRQRVVDREQATDPEKLRGSRRVDIESVDHLTYRARDTATPNFEIVVDEPHERGGRNQGPSPIAYFLTGAGACLLNQFIIVSIAEGLNLRFQQNQVKGEFRREVGGSFQSITQDVFVEGDASEAVMQKLTEKAEAFCFIHMTLNKAVKMTTVVHLNGKEVVRRISEPAVPAGH